MFSHKDITKDLSRAKKFFEDIISYTIGPYTLKEIIDNHINTINIIDVRDYDNYSKGHIPYAIHMPYEKTDENCKLLDKEKLNVVYTYTDSCPRAYNTALKLVENDFKAVVLRGGFKAWKKSDFEITKTDVN